MSCKLVENILPRKKKKNAWNNEYEKWKNINGTCSKIQIFFLYAKSNVRIKTKQNTILIM